MWLGLYGGAVRKGSTARPCYSILCQECVFSKPATPSMSKPAMFKIGRTCQSKFSTKGMEAREANVLCDKYMIAGINHRRQGPCRHLHEGHLIDPNGRRSCRLLRRQSWPESRDRENQPRSHAGPPIYWAVVKVISTRRFFCRPSGLSAPFGKVFGSTGFDRPQPRTAIPAVTPWLTNHWRTDCARRSDRAWLY
jgi:hypothetical protein